jgi:hypothetical protein
MMRGLAFVVMGLTFTACAPVLLSPEEAAVVCEQQARAAQGPTGSVTVGINSDSGPSTSVAVGLSSDFLAGRDPMDVYNECVLRRSGQPPIRPPVLRDR